MGFYVLVSLLGGFVIFYGVGGWLKWHYYRSLRERAADWKCQPELFLSPEDDKLEFWLGTFNMAMASTISGRKIIFSQLSAILVRIESCMVNATIPSSTSGLA